LGFRSSHRPFVSYLMNNTVTNIVSQWLLTSGPQLGSEPNQITLSLLPELVSGSGFPCSHPCKKISLSAMAKKTKIALIVVLVFVCALAAAFYNYNRSAVGIPAFYVWKAVSGKAHGGQYADINGVRIYYETFGKGVPCWCSTVVQHSLRACTIK